MFSRRLMRGLVFAIVLWPIAAAWAQRVEHSTTIVSSDVASRIPAFSYQEGPKSKLLLVGTPLTPTAKGKASVEFQDGRSIVKAEVAKLPQPASLGPYTTYVLWAVTPDGRATNIGAIETTRRGKGELRTSYSGSQFALVIAAEPHFAVSIPSTAVVLFNVAGKVKGKESKVTSLVERADYSKLAGIAVDLEPAPAALMGARYALAIAEAAGADEYAAAEYKAAKAKLLSAESAQVSRRSRDRRQAAMLAREAAQAGEDARRAGMAGKAAAEEAARRSEAAAAAAAQATESERLRSAELAAETAGSDLRRRLSSVLPTTVSSRGLVSEIGGAEFSTGSATLSAAARESLSRFVGVVATYADLRYTIEGHTDSTGSPDKNRELSLNRAIAVRDYLIAQGLRASSIDVAGFGGSKPVASNATAGGRAANRRVEIVVSGAPLSK